MTAADIKLALLEYFRFTRQFVCATEMSIYSGVSDVVAYDLKNLLIDVEVKISKADFLADFEKRKHLIYNDESAINRISKKSNVPNRFYFAIPEELEEVVKKKLEDYPKYGLIMFHEAKGCVYPYVDSLPKKLHNNPVNRDKVTNMFLLRLNSEVITRTKKILELNKELKNGIQ